MMYAENVACCVALPCYVLVHFHSVVCQPLSRLVGREAIGFEISLRLTAEAFEYKVRRYLSTTMI